MYGDAASRRRREGSPRLRSPLCADRVSFGDTIEASGRTWKTYAEGLPSVGYLGPSSRRYAKKHDPFAYFPDVADNPRRRARIVPLSRLGADLGAGTLPSFSLVVPDLCHSM